MANTTLKLATTTKPNKNTLTTQKQTYHNIIDYSDKPFGYYVIPYEKLLEINGEKFDPFNFNGSDGKSYSVDSYSGSPWQRDTESRVATNTGPNGHFNDLNVMARYVCSTLYIGKPDKVNGEHDVETNTLVFNDAHARMLASKLHISRNPKNKKCTLNIPENWVLLITVTDDIEDLETNYNANDNKKATKTKRHEVQSMLKALNFLPNLHSDFIRQGNFASSIDIAVPVKKSSPKALQDLEMIDQIKLIKKSLELVDKKLTTVTRPVAEAPNVLIQHQVFGTVLQFVQDSAFGNDPRMLTVIERLIKNDEDKKNVTHDGIWTLCNIFDGNSSFYQQLQTQIGSLYVAFKPMLNKKTNSSSSLLPLSKGMVYYERTEGPNLVVFLINHYLSTKGAAVDWNTVNWPTDIKGKYKNLVNYVYNGGTSI